MKRQCGFTLIELLVTMVLMAIFFMFAMSMMTNGFHLSFDYRNRNQVFFEQSVKSATADRIVRENRGKCSEDGRFSFVGEKNDSLLNRFPYPEIFCKINSQNQIIVYTKEWSGLIRK